MRAHLGIGDRDRQLARAPLLLPGGARLSETRNQGRQVHGRIELEERFRGLAAADVYRADISPLDVANLAATPPAPTSGYEIPASELPYERQVWDEADPLVFRRKVRPGGKPGLYQQALEAYGGRLRGAQVPDGHRISRKRLLSRS